MAEAALRVVAPAEREKAELVDRARRGDHDAYELLMRRHEQAAFRAALLIVKWPADAEDVAQEAFIKAYRALGRFRSGARFRPWLLRIVGNEARNHRRASGRRDFHQHRAGVLEAARPGTPPDEELLRDEDRRRLVAMVNRLPEGERTAIVARYLADLTDAEAAALLNVPRATIKMRAWRGLQRLRKELGEKR